MTRGEGDELFTSLVTLLQSAHLLDNAVTLKFGQDPQTILNRSTYLHSV